MRGRGRSWTCSRRKSRRPACQEPLFRFCLSPHINHHHLTPAPFYSQLHAQPSLHGTPRQPTLSLCGVATTTETKLYIKKSLREPPAPTLFS